MSGKVAIVGAGPSGCYLAQALLKAAPELEVDLIDALPVPYGLVRYGVAADHQGTKAVARQFARVFERQGAQFWGNVALGREVTLEALQGAYDAVVLAAGLAGDRRLGVPGDDLPGVHGAGRLTRALYEHPEAEALPALGAHPLIVGNGNVAIDLLRLLAKAPGWLWKRDPPIRQRRHQPTSWLELVLREGRNRQVRRMTAAVGLPTLRLVRLQIGPYGLDGLAPGRWRPLEV